MIGVLLQWSENVGDDRNGPSMTQKLLPVCAGDVSNVSIVLRETKDLLYLL